MTHGGLPHFTLLITSELHESHLSLFIHLDINLCLGSGRLEMNKLGMLT